MVVAGDLVVRDESRAHDRFSNAQQLTGSLFLSKGWGQQAARRRMSSMATRPPPPDLRLVPAVSLSASL